MVKAKRKKRNKYQREKRKLQKNCDALWQKIITYKAKCLVCGKKADVGHHFITKALSAYLRYSIQNGIPLDNSGCHFKHHRQNDPEIHATIIRKKGFIWYNDLQIQRNTLIKIDKKYYQQKLEDLKKIYEQKTCG